MLRALLVCLAAAVLLVASAPPAGARQAGEGPAPALQWNAWGPEAFARAARENKPILLFIATGWTKASAYIDEKIFSDPEVIGLANERWIPIRVERDRRPDIEIRYRIAVSTVLGEGVGFPLIAMLSKEGEVLFGKSFIPLDDRREGPGLRSFLRVGAERYAAMPDSAGGYRAFVAEALAKESRPRRSAEIAAGLMDAIASGLVASQDREFGGFGSLPRLPNPYTLEFAATRHHRTGDPAMRDALVAALDGMEAGAIYDRIAGGFHRVASDAAWRRPVFEKMLNYNVTLLEAYTLGWQATGNEDYRVVANRTLDWILGTLLAPGGGFHVAQMGIAGPSDGKDLYYTWSKQEFDATVPARWLDLSHRLFNVTAEGDLMLGEPPRNLLYRKMTRAEAGKAAALDAASLRAAEDDILAALGAVRAKRPALPIDESLYVDSTALAAASLLAAGPALGRDDAVVAARAAADRLLAAIPADGPMRHRLHPSPDPALDPPMAADHVIAAWALLAAFEESGERRYRDAAIDLMRRAEELFWDAETGGFFDTAADPNGFGYGSRRLRLNDDSGYPALNALAARVFDRLRQHTGEARYHEQAALCLKVVIATADAPDHRHGSLGLALDAHLRAPTRYVVVGPAGARAADLTRAAYKVFDPGKIVQRIVPGDEEAAAVIAALGVTPAEGVWAAACAGTRCSEAATDAGAVAALRAPRDDGMVQGESR